MVDKVILFSISIEELKSIIGEIVEEKLKEVVPKIVPTLTSQKEFLSSQEVCHMLQIKMVTLWRYSKDGKLKAHRIGRRIFYRSEEIREALKT